MNGEQVIGATVLLADGQVGALGGVLGVTALVLIGGVGVRAPRQVRRERGGWEP